MLRAAGQTDGDDLACRDPRSFERPHDPQDAVAESAIADAAIPLYQGNLVIAGIEKVRSHTLEEGVFVCPCLVTVMAIVARINDGAGINIKQAGGDDMAACLVQRREDVAHQIALYCLTGIVDIQYQGAIRAARKANVHRHLRRLGQPGTQGHGAAAGGCWPGESIGDDNGQHRACTPGFKQLTGNIHPGEGQMLQPFHHVVLQLVCPVYQGVPGTTPLDGNEAGSVGKRA